MMDEISGEFELQQRNIDKNDTFFYLQSHFTELAIKRAYHGSPMNQLG